MPLSHFLSPNASLSVLVISTPAQLCSCGMTHLIYGVWSMTRLRRWIYIYSGDGLFAFNFQATQIPKIKMLVVNRPVRAVLIKAGPSCIHFNCICTAKNRVFCRIRRSENAELVDSWNPPPHSPTTNPCAIHYPGSATGTRNNQAHQAPRSSRCTGCVYWIRKQVETLLTMIFRSI
jgi:hypothetical protein